MARLLADEDLARPVVNRLRALGHDVLTALEAGVANQRITDDTLLTYAAAEYRLVLTHNRSDFIRLHRARPDHGGIIVCRQATDPELLAERIHAALADVADSTGVLIRVYLETPPQVTRG